VFAENLVMRKAPGTRDAAPRWMRARNNSSARRWPC